MNWCGLDNAEAVDITHAPAPGDSHPEVAGSAGGLWAGEIARRTLTDADLDGIIGAEVAERLAAADEYERSGHREPADRLRAEAAVLRRYVPDPGSG